MTSYPVNWRKTIGIALDANGNGTLSFQDMAHNYIIEQVSVKVENGDGGTCQISINGSFICGTESGALDSADGPPPIDLRAGETLTIVWANVAGGNSANATLIGKAVVYS